MNEGKYYLRVSKASDFKKRKERIIYRALEMLPGTLSWATIIGAFILSYFKPLWVAIFVILFALYWLFKALYFSFYLRASYKILKRNQNTDWLQKLKNLSSEQYNLPLKSWKEIYHLVVLPMYNEPFEIVNDTFEHLANCHYPKDKLIVILATEERAGRKAQIIGEKIQKLYGDKFLKLAVTTHPDNIPGELKAKSANELWASKKAKEIIDQMKIPYENVIYSSFDIDTVIFPDYFSRLTYCYLTSKNPLRTSFQPIPLFLNNIWQVPVISRVFSLSTSFWHIINQEREEKLITFSSHSMPFKALVDVGFKMPNVVSDDSRIFWQCLLYYDGEYYTKPLYYPISMDANLAESFFKTLKHIYKQQRRWAYGAGEIPYAIFGFLKNKNIDIRKKISFSLELLESHWNWACGSIILLFFGWLPLVLGGQDFSQTIFAYNLSRMVGRILTASMIGLLSSAYYAFYILPPKSPGAKKKNPLLIVLEWFTVPFTMVFFTSLPALDAQTRWFFGKYMGFWVTPKIRKHPKTSLSQGTPRKGDPQRRPKGTVPKGRGWLSP